MHEISTIFGELAALALLAIVVTLALRRIGLPPVAGLILAGALAGPNGFGVVGGEGRIELLAEVGVVLLLFTIGLEFSLERLKAIARVVLIGGTLQVGLTSGSAALVCRMLGLSVAHSVLVGFVFALSSTAVVLRALGERQETDAPHGRFIVGVLIFQDLVVVPMLLVVSALAGDSASVFADISIALTKAVLVVVGALLLARYAVPRVLKVVDSNRSSEIFGLGLVAFALGIPWFTSHLGLSLALGAFLAGVIIADSDFAHRAMSDVIPARDVLTSLFFISMGMLFNWQVVVSGPLDVLLLLLALLFGKGLFAAVAALVMRFPARVASLAGAALAQFGEFGFVLAMEGVRVGIVTREQMEPLFAAGLLSMFVTRMVISIAPRFSAGEVLLRPLEKLLRVRGIDEVEPEHEHIKGHVVIVGFGPGGRALAKRLEAQATPYLVLDLNAATVGQERANSVPIYYGDVTSHEVRVHARCSDARAIVLQISDQAAALRAVAAIRSDGLSVPIYARVRREGDAARVRDLGAQYVVCEEESASERLADRVMEQLAGSRT